MELSPSRTAGDSFWRGWVRDWQSWSAGQLDGAGQLAAKLTQFN